MGIKPNYLRKKRGSRWVSYYELMVMIINVVEVYRRKELGFDDVHRQLEDFLKELRRKKVLMDTSLIESCLCAMSFLKATPEGMKELEKPIELDKFVKPMCYKHEKWNPYFSFFEHVDDGGGQDD